MSNRIEKILKNWNIPQDLPIREIDESDGVHYLGHIWFIDDKYVLKKHNIKELDNYIKKQKILTALDEQGFSTSSLCTENGEVYCECIEEESIYTLAKYVKGKTLTTDEIRSEKMPEYGYKLGQAMAKLHIALASLEYETSINETNMYKSVIEWAIPKMKKANIVLGMELQESLFDDYIENFGKLHDKLPKQLIHSDSHPDNIIFNNGEVSGFIDFIIGEHNVRLRDVCYCLTGIADDFYDNPEKWIDVVKQTLNGYNSINPLTNEEKQSIFYVMCSIQFTCVAFFEGNDIFKQAFEINCNLTPFIIELKDRIVEIGMMM